MSGPIHVRRTEIFSRLLDVQARALKSLLLPFHSSVLGSETCLALVYAATMLRRVFEGTDSNSSQLDTCNYKLPNIRRRYTIWRN